MGWGQGTIVQPTSSLRRTTPPPLKECLHLLPPIPPLPEQHVRCCLQDRLSNIEVINILNVLSIYSSTNSVPGVDTKKDLFFYQYGIACIEKSANNVWMEKNKHLELRYKKKTIGAFSFNFSFVNCS